MRNYKEIKEILLEDENIYSVNYNTDKKKIVIKPIQNKSFYTTDEPINKYSYEDEDGEDMVTRYNIGGRVFKMKHCEHYNTTIYEIELKEIV